jgi:polyphenol oxidase
LTILSLTTQARDGDLRPAAALARYLRRKKWPQAIATGKQVHGTKVQVVGRLSKAIEHPDTDGFLTDVPGQPLGIYTADCLPIFLADTRKSVVGLLHAGWRGVHGKILQTAVRRLRRQWKSRPSDLRYWVGPCIQPCCFEVQWDVARHFPHSRRRRGDRWTLDLPKEIRRQARQLGLKEQSRKSTEACTMHRRRHFSFRRNATPKRQISIIVFT